MQNGPVTPEVSACLWGGRIAWKEERGDFSGVMEMFDVSFFLSDGYMTIHKDQNPLNQTLKTYTFYCMQRIGSIRRTT